MDDVHKGEIDLNPFAKEICFISSQQQQKMRLTKSALSALNHAKQQQKLSLARFQSISTCAHSNLLINNSSSLLGHRRPLPISDTVLTKNVVVLSKLWSHNAALSLTCSYSSSQANPTDFTEMAWEGMVRAIDAARNNKQQIVESEHLMKALLEQKDGLARRILTKAGLDNSSVLQATNTM